MHVQKVSYAPATFLLVCNPNDGFQKSHDMYVDQKQEILFVMDARINEGFEWVPIRMFVDLLT